MITEDWKNATPEKVNAWKKFIALLPGVQTITPIYYVGAIAGTEFLTYSTKKLYFAMDLEITQGLAALVDPGYSRFYDETNTISFYGSEVISVWNATAAAFYYITNPYKSKDIYFSRFFYSLYSTIKFNGYRLTVP